MLGIDLLNLNLLSLVWLLPLLLKIWALVDAAFRRAELYEAGNKMTKTGWLIILGLTVAVALVAPEQFLLNLAGIIAAIVYIVDVRPVLRSLGRRR